LFSTRKRKGKGRRGKGGRKGRRKRVPMTESGQGGTRPCCSLGHKVTFRVLVWKPEVMSSSPSSNTTSYVAVGKPYLFPGHRVRFP
jgi:hypothetical protein